MSEKQQHPGVESDGQGGPRLRRVRPRPPTLEEKLAAAERNRRLQMQIADLGVRIEIGEEITDDVKRKKLESDAINNLLIAVMR